eukprot:scaffold15390_cov97-Phaeocystis_antarctica.AAC.2
MSGFASVVHCSRIRRHSWGSWLFALHLFRSARTVTKVTVGGATSSGIRENHGCQKRTQQPAAASSCGCLSLLAPPPGRQPQPITAALTMRVRLSVDLCLPTDLVTLQAQLPLPRTALMPVHGGVVRKLVGDHWHHRRRGTADRDR